MGRARGIRAQGLVALGLSCTVGGACTAPEAVLFDLVADVEGDYLGFVSGTHVELRPRIEGTWFDRQDDELPDELWVFDQPPGLAFGRYPVVRELSGGHKLPTPKVRLVRDDDVDLVSYREAGGSVRMVGVEGCPLVRVFKVGLSRPRREVILYDFGSSALVQNTDEESAEDLEVVHADGRIQFARVSDGVPRIGGGRYFGGAQTAGGATVDGLRFVYSSGGSVVVASTTTSPPLVDARVVEMGTSWLEVKPRLSASAWASAGYSAITVYSADGVRRVRSSPLTRGGPMVLDEDGHLVGVSAQDYVSVAILETGESWFLGDRPPLQFGLVDRLGLAAVWRDAVMVRQGSQWGPLIFDRAPTLAGRIRLHPGGFVVLDGGGSLSHVDERGHVCPEVELGAEFSTYGVIETDPCGGPGCRWRTTVVSPNPNELYFITPLE